MKISPHVIFKFFNLMDSNVKNFKAENYYQNLSCNFIFSKNNYSKKNA